MDDVFPRPQKIMKPYPQRNCMTKNHYFATVYHTFTGLVKARLEFWLVDFGSFSDFQIVHQKLLLMQYLQLLYYKTFFDVSPVNHTHLLTLLMNLMKVKYYMRDIGGKITHTQILLLPTHKQNNSYQKMLRLLVAF